MKKRPAGRKFRNLFARGATIYYERVVSGRRVKFSCATDDWNEAAAVRDLYEARKQIGVPVEFRRADTFAELADSFLEKWMTNLAETTRDDRRSLLRAASDEKPAGILRIRFGELRVDEIRRPVLLEWWQEAIEAKGRSHKTGRNYLDALSGVLALAVDAEMIDANPVDGLRAVLRRRNRTQKGRADTDPGARVAPIEDPEQLAAFVEKSREAGGASHVVDLLCLDAGLRLGEATALRWEDCAFGSDASDTRRSLRIRASRSRGTHLGATKSGRERTVAMSRRLRTALLAFQLEQGRPEAGPITLVDHANYRKRHFKAVCAAAEVDPARKPDGTTRLRSPKDLRDTYASQLLTAGVQLGYVSRQLGHADVSVTARHYARWAGGDAYRSPLEVSKGEVPADLLSRLATEAVPLEMCGGRKGVPAS